MRRQMVSVVIEYHRIVRIYFQHAVVPCIEFFLVHAYLFCQLDAEEQKPQVRRVDLQVFINRLNGFLGFLPHGVDPITRDGAVGIVLPFAAIDLVLGLECFLPFFAFDVLLFERFEIVLPLVVGIRLVRLAESLLRQTVLMQALVHDPEVRQCPSVVRLDRVAELQQRVRVRVPLVRDRLPRSIPVIGKLLLLFNGQLTVRS